MAKGIDIVNVAKPHAIANEEYVFGADVPKDDPTWEGPWDCAEFVSWCIYQAAKILYGVENDHGDPAHANAYTGFFARDAQTLGIVISLAEAYRTPGAVLLRQPGYHGMKTGHVVISDGKGGTIEAMDTNDGVVFAHAGGRTWSTGILIPGVEYDIGHQVVVDPPRPAPGWPRILFYTIPNMDGSDVVKLQKLLNSKGTFKTKIPEDGRFGKLTLNAVVAFQRQAGIVADGMAGPQTIRMLEK